MQTRIYLSHCCALKDDALKETGIKVTPDKLYRSLPIRRFMKTCIERKVDWAIFSDRYGVWFPHLKHIWYDKPPDTVTADEFRKLLKSFSQKLSGYAEIWFYCNYGRLHPFYRKLLSSTVLKKRIRLFCRLREIYL